MILLLAVLALAPTYTKKELLSAIHQVETGGKTGAILGDGGKALGPLQIHLSYWKDASEKWNDKGSYSDCSKLDYSNKVADAYFIRYAKSFWSDKMTLADCENVARCHNSGWNWKKKLKSTDAYWAKVKKELGKK